MRFTLHDSFTQSRDETVSVVQRTQKYNLPSHYNNHIHTHHRDKKCSELVFTTIVAG